jgi:hypothetical protein
MEVDPIYGRIEKPFNQKSIYNNRYDYLQHYSYSISNNIGSKIKTAIFDEANIENAINKKFKQIFPTQNSENGSGVNIEKQKDLILNRPPIQKFRIK